MPGKTFAPPGQAIDYFNKSHPLMPLQGRISVWMRQKMFNCLPLQAGMRVLEVGATPNLDLMDSNFFSLRAKQAGCDVSVSSIEDCSRMAYENGFHWIPFAQLQTERSAPFDFVISSAVLEHVGAGDANKRHHLELLSEVSRQWIAVMTPNRSHWMEIHTKLPFIHWLPKPLHRKILDLIGMRDWSDPDHLDLLGAGDFEQIVNHSFPDAHVQICHFWFLGWISNLMALIEKQPAASRRLG